MNECMIPADRHFGTWHTDDAGRCIERCPTRLGEWRAARFTLGAAGVPVAYQGYSRDGYVDWPKEADEWLAQPGMLYIHGPNGSGKTRIAIALLDAVQRDGVPGRYASAKLIPELQPDRNEGDRAMLEKWRTVRVLVLDDLFSEGTFRAEQVRNLVEVRWRDGKPTIATSMKGPGAALALDSDLASRVMSGRIIERKGKDLRMFPRAAEGGR